MEWKKLIVDQVDQINCSKSEGFYKPGSNRRVQWRASRWGKAWNRLCCVPASSSQPAVSTASICIQYRLRSTGRAGSVLDGGNDCKRKPRHDTCSRHREWRCDGRWLKSVQFHLGTVSTAELRSHFFPQPRKKSHIGYLSERKSLCIGHSWQISTAVLIHLHILSSNLFMVNLSICSLFVMDSINYFSIFQFPSTSSHSQLLWSCLERKPTRPTYWIVIDFKGQLKN